jgi:hypothetical protein
VPIHPDELAASLQRLERTGDDPDVLRALQDGVLACTDLFAVTGSGLMIADAGQILRHVVSSDPPGHALETVEADHGEGPCTDSFVNNTVTLTPDLAVDPRWPHTAAAVAPLGVHAVLGIPIRLSGIPLGTLDVYRNVPHHWDDTEKRALTRYGEVIELILTAAFAAQRAGELTEQLQYALDHRVVIERAIGYLMGRQQLDAVAAFNRLRRAARSQRRTVGDVGREVLQTGTLAETRDC